MPTDQGSPVERVRALDIEVRIPAEPGRKAVWVDHPEEAGRWIRAIAEPLFREALDAEVHAGHAYAEEDSYVQFFTVAASPSEANREIVRHRPAEFAERLRHDLAIKFDSSATQPVVNIDADKSFVGSSSGASRMQPPAGPAGPVGEAGPRAAPPPQSTMQPQAAMAPPPPRRGPMLWWMAAALGGSLIANAFLGWQVADLRKQSTELAKLREDASKLNVDLRLTEAARAFEKSECAKSIGEHRQMIADLAKKCMPSQPAPTPPPLPSPYPASPNPYEPPR